MGGIRYMTGVLEARADLADLAFIRGTGQRLLMADESMYSALPIDEVSMPSSQVPHAVNEAQY